MKIKIILLFVFIVIIIVGGYYLVKHNFNSYTLKQIPNYSPNRVEEYNEWIAETVTQNEKMDYLSSSYTVLLGDSITYRLKNDENFPDNTIDVGIPGATSYDVASDLDQIYFTLDTSKVSRVFITLGTNDNILTKYDPTYETDDSANNINYIIQQIHEDNPDIEIFVVSPPPNRGGISDRIPDKNDFLDSVTNSIALNLDSHATYLNIHEQIKDEDGFLPEKSTVDGLHLNTQGYVQVIALIKEELENQQKTK